MWIVTHTDYRTTHRRTTLQHRPRSVHGGKFLWGAFSHTCMPRKPSVHFMSCLTSACDNKHAAISNLLHAGDMRRANLAACAPMRCCARPRASRPRVHGSALDCSRAAPLCANCDAPQHQQGYPFSSTLHILTRSHMCANVVHWLGGIGTGRTQPRHAHAAPVGRGTWTC